MAGEDKKREKETPVITITYSSTNEMQFTECLEKMIRNHFEDKGDIWIN